MSAGSGQGIESPPGGSVGQSRHRLHHGPPATVAPYPIALPDHLAGERMWHCSRRVQTVDRTTHGVAAPRTSRPRTWRGAGLRFEVRHRSGDRFAGGKSSKIIRFDHGHCGIQLIRAGSMPRRSLHAEVAFSIASAIPIPPLTHRVATPRFALRLSIS
jgi:hypothetical protein